MQMEFSLIRQVIGVAYTYPSSGAVRHRLAATRPDHSSHHRDFSYFRKVESSEDIVRNMGSLRLRRHPETGAEIRHWSEPELAILLGHNHHILAYCLANDFTAAEIELQSLASGEDPTHQGKCWKGSVSLGPRFFTPEEIGDDGILEIGFRIQRGAITVFDGTYNTKSRLRSFVELPQLIVDYYLWLLDLHGSFSALPASKRIIIEQHSLPEGTVILAGSGIIKVNETYNTRVGDQVTIYSRSIGELTNPIDSGELK